MSGDTTTARPGRINAGAWKHSDLPPPVGITSSESRPVRIASITSRWSGRNVRVAPVPREDVFKR